MLVHGHVDGGRAVDAGAAGGLGGLGAVDEVLLFEGAHVPRQLRDGGGVQHDRPVRSSGSCRRLPVCAAMTAVWTAK